jgi:hypothetical protein
MAVNRAVKKPLARDGNSERPSSFYNAARVKSVKKWPAVAAIRVRDQSIFATFAEVRDRIALYATE